ncbi:potassium channel family protein [Gaoshiqia sp. Z1-71]|uniref:potassium channel family protein n=1 Tax=Gaoshiqia hydrogeniformans TaxID=3290090 RepID=UPI003BF89A16
MAVSEKNIVLVIKEKKSELAVTAFVAFVVLLMASFIMYYLEAEDQPDAFPNILAAFWWAIATLTTVGYGDVYPVTAMGKLLSGLIAVMGIGLVALPTGLISAGFMNKIERKKSGQICPHCGKKIDEHEK